MVGAADNPPRPTMSMLGDHQVLGGLQQLVRRPAEENTFKAHLPDGEPGISTTVATDETNAGESDAAAFGGGQGGRRHGGIDEEKAAGQTTQQLEMMRLEDWGEERLPEELEDSLDLASGEKRKGGWWTDSWISQKLFGDAAGEGGEVSDSPLKVGSTSTRLDAKSETPRKENHSTCNEEGSVRTQEGQRQKKEEAAIERRESERYSQEDRFKF